MSLLEPLRPLRPLAALLEEAESGAQQQFVVFVCEDGEGTNVTKINVHAPIARVFSDLVLTAQCTKVGAERDSREITVPFSVRVMERVRGYMYGAPLGLDTLGDAVEFLNVASFLIMPDMQKACMSVVEGCIYTEKYTLDSLVSIWLLICETGIDGPVELVRVALVRMLMANCAVAMKNPVIAKLIEVTTLPDLVRLTCGLEDRRVMCVHLAIELALMWGNVHADSEQPDGAEQSQEVQRVLAHVVNGLPECCVRELEDRGLIPVPEHAALEAREAATKRRKSNQRVGAWWTGRVGEDVCAVGLCGPKMIVEALRGFPFNCAGTSVHTPQVVRVEGPSCSYLTFPFLRPLGALECTEPDAPNPNSLMLMRYLPPPREAFQTGYVLANCGSGRWLPFGIIPPFMGNRDSRYAAAARGTLIYFVKMCGTGADCALFDVKTCTWAQLPPLLVSRSWPCIAMTDGHLYVIGGGQTERLCVTGLTSLPPVGLEWEGYGPCVLRTKSAAVFVSPFIYVVGGVCHETGQMFAAVTRISTVDGSRIELPAMIEPRMCPGAFAQEGPEGIRVCVIGGMETYYRRRFVRAESLTSLTSLAVADAEPKWQALEVQHGSAK